MIEIRINPHLKQSVLCFFERHPKDKYSVLEGRESDGTRSRQIQRVRCGECLKLLRVTVGEWFDIEKSRKEKGKVAKYGTDS